MRVFPLGIGGIVTAGLLAVPAIAVPLYDVDFSSPPHTLDQKPLVGSGPAPRLLPSSISGTPRVVSASAGLDSEPLYLSGYCCGPWDPDAVFFQLSDLAAYPYVALNMDLSIESIATDTGHLRLSFGSSPANWIDFRWDFGTGAATEVRSGFLSHEIGPWTPGTPVHLRVVIVPASGWWVFLDHVQVFTDARTLAVPTEFRLETIGGASAAIDNVLINGDTPPVPVEDASWGGIKAIYR